MFTKAWNTHSLHSKYELWSWIMKCELIANVRRSHARSVCVHVKCFFTDAFSLRVGRRGKDNSAELNRDGLKQRDIWISGVKRMSFCLLIMWTEPPNNETSRSGVCFPRPNCFCACVCNSLSCSQVILRDTPFPTVCTALAPVSCWPLITSQTEWSASKFNS